MSDRRSPRRESEWLADLDFNPSRGAPPGATERVRQRLRGTVAGLAEAPSPQPAARAPLSWSARRRSTTARSMLLVAAAVLLVGGVGAAIRAVVVLRTSPSPAADPPTQAPRAPAQAPHQPAAPRAPEPPEQAEEAPLDTPSEQRAIEAPHPATPPPVEVRRAPVQKPTAVPAPETVPTPEPVSEPPSFPSSSTLMAERALLDRARAALGAGQYDEAERALDLHAATFSSGLLAEEREALAVRTLAAAGRGNDARERAARFQMRFPHSLFAPAVLNAVHTIP